MIVADGGRCSVIQRDSHMPLLEKRRREPLSFIYSEGLSGLDTAGNQNRSKDWYIGKTGKYEELEFPPEEQLDAAIRFAKHIWSLNTDDDRKAKEDALTHIREAIGERAPVYLTVPSTTGMNLVTNGLAILIRDIIGLNGQILDGRNYARYAKPAGSDIMQMKGVERKLRSYMIREYGFKAGGVDALRSDVADTPIIVVEDVCTSGVSARGFCEALHRNGFILLALFTGLGKSRLVCNEYDITEMQTFFDNAGIKQDAQLLARYLTPSQLRGIRYQFRDSVHLTKKEKENIAEALTARLSNGDKEIMNVVAEITGNLQRLFDQGTLAYSRGTVDAAAD